MNSAEAGLEKKQQPRPQYLSLCISLFIASFNIAIRPTCMDLWIMLFYGSTVLEFFRFKMNSSIRTLFIHLMLFTLILPLVPVLSVIYLDNLFYGGWKFPMLNFASFNLFADPGKFFGRAPWHFYLMEGPIVVFFSFLPFIISGSLILSYKILGFFIAGSDEASHEVCQHDRGDPQVLVPGPVVQRKRYKKEVVKPATQEINSLQQQQLQQHKTNRPPLFDIGCVISAIVCSIVLLSQATHKEHRLLVPFIRWFYHSPPMDSGIHASVQLLQ